MGGLTQSWAIAKATWQVLMAEEGLLIFPVLSGVFTVLAAAAFILPAAVIAGLLGSRSSSQQSGDPLPVVLLFLFYLVTSFITLFFNTAMVSIALERLRGGDPRVGEGFRVAVENLGSIFLFAVASATVGVVLRLIEDKHEIIGSIVSSILGAAWAVVTFLVVPVMVVEKQGPFAAIRRSGELLRQTWGAQLAGNLGIGIIVFLMALLGLIPLALGFLSATGVGVIVGIAIAIIYWGLVAVVGSALGQIYRAAVYLYASSSVVPAGFDGWMIQGAFKPR
jgi:hypothetical protein